jgi:hypothetical protein
LSRFFTRFQVDWNIVNNNNIVFPKYIINLSMFVYNLHLNNLSRENVIDKQIIAPGVGCQNDRDTTSLSILGGGFL